MRAKSLIVGVLGLALLSGTTAARQAAGEKVTDSEAESARRAIADYIQRDTKLKGGFFLYDPVLKQVVRLKFDHVHEGVTRAAGGHYVACVDMRSVRRSLCDVDVYLEQTDQGLKPAKLVIHRVDGKERKGPLEPR